MQKRDFLNKDLNGQVIDQKAKDSKSVEVDGNSRFAGKRFLLKTKLYGDKRCIYCGRWFHWKDTDYLTWVNEKNINTMNLDSVLEPLHCGSSMCRDYHFEWLQEVERRKQMASECRTWELFRDLQNKGVVR